MTNNAIVVGEVRGGEKEVKGGLGVDFFEEKISELVWCGIDFERV